MYLKNKKIPNEVDIISLWIKKIEYKKYLQSDTLYPDTIFILEMLCNKYNLFLITARSNRHNAFWQLSKLNITKYFQDTIIVKNTGNVGLNKYNAIKSICVDFVIGDTETDQDLSEYANCIFYPLNNGFRSQSYWEHLHKKSYSGLQEVIEKII
jgi:hypothetical protein